jgi:hypothetical protein
MPGLGRRTFAPGEVLTATNVMGYLQDQAVMNFADDGARGSAIGTAVSQGMVSFVQNTGNIEAYYDTFGTANPGGASPAGWYPSSKLLFVASASRDLVSGTTYTAGLAGFSYLKNLDALNWHNPSVNPDRITPNIAGYYRITVTYQQATVASAGTRQMQVFKNLGRVPGAFLSINDASSNFMNMNGSFIVSMNGSTDYFQIPGIIQVSGVTVTAVITVNIEYLRPNV